MPKSGRLKVYVPFRDGQNYKAAEEYGEVVKITDGEVERYNTQKLYSTISEAMTDIEENDYILISGLTLSNCIASAIMARKFGHVNFLLFRRGEYLARRVMLPSPDHEGDDRERLE